jgi:hypothetical protein
VKIPSVYEQLDLGVHPSPRWSLDVWRQRQIRRIAELEAKLRKQGVEP